jgi:hypothetical protein
MAGRRIRVALTFGLLAALGAPVALDRDGFPLSTYPMYSWARPADVDFVTANAVTATGERRRLSLELIGQSDDPLIVAGELRSAVRRGRVDQRCAEIAGRVAERRVGDAELPVSVEVVTERHDVVALVSDDDSLLERTVHAECGVESP